MMRTIIWRMDCEPTPMSLDSQELFDSSLYSSSAATGGAIEKEHKLPFCSGLRQELPVPTHLGLGRI